MDKNLIPIQSFIFTFINEVPLFWMQLPEQDLRVEFEKVFKDANKNLLKNYFDKWGGDFARFLFRFKSLFFPL